VREPALRIVKTCGHREALDQPQVDAPKRWGMAPTFWANHSPWVNKNGRATDRRRTAGGAVAR